MFLSEYRNRRDLLTEAPKAKTAGVEETGEEVGTDLEAPDDTEGDGDTPAPEEGEEEPVEDEPADDGFGEEEPADDGFGEEEPVEDTGEEPVEGEETEEIPEEPAPETPEDKRKKYLLAGDVLDLITTSEDLLNTYEKINTTEMGGKELEVYRELLATVSDNVDKMRFLLSRDLTTIQYTKMLAVYLAMQMSTEVSANLLSKFSTN
jgi:hypothetical protein